MHWIEWFTSWTGINSDALGFATALLTVVGLIFVVGGAVDLLRPRAKAKP